MNKSTQRLTMTLLEAYYAMRDAGIPCSPKMISAGIASGAYPFGRVVATGETGRRTLQIFRVDFEAWLEAKIPLNVRTDVLAKRDPLVLNRQVM